MIKELATALIENSLHLHIYENDIRSLTTGAMLNTKDLMTTLKKEVQIHSRKLLTCSNYQLSRNKDKFRVWPMLG